MDSANLRVVFHEDGNQVAQHLLESKFVKFNFKIGLLEVIDWMVWVFVRLETKKVRLNLNFLSVRFLHLHDLVDGVSDVNVLTVLDEVFCLELAICQHVFNVKSQLIGHG